MRHIPGLTLLALVAAACHPPDKLTDDTTGDTDVTDTDLSHLSLTAALPALFTKFESGCDALGPLVLAVEAGIAAKPIVLDGDKSQRSFEIDPLPHEGLDVTWPPDTDPNLQTPVVDFGLSTKDFATNVSVALEPNQVCIESSSTVWYERTYTEGTPAELEAGTIDVLRSTAEIRKELIIAKGWYDLKIDFRACTLDDGRKFLAQRAWAEASYPGDKGANSFTQTFVAQLWVDDGHGKVERVYAIWPQIDVGLGPDAMKALIRDSLFEGFERADEFADVTDGNYAYCSQDREAAKPPRG